MPSSQETNSPRAFIAACLGTELIERVRREQQRLEQALGNQLIRWTLPEQWHLTLQFLGNVRADAVGELILALQRAVTGCTPFQLVIRDLGAFPSPQRPRVLWVGLAGEVDSLLRLQAGIVEQCSVFGSHSEERKFHPHLTLGRVKSFGPETRRIGEVIGQARRVDLGEWPVTEITLMQSHLSPKGSRYTVLTRVPLK
jgi:2'-5' RNA ligase